MENEEKGKEMKRKGEGGSRVWQRRAEGGVAREREQWHRGRRTTKKQRVDCSRGCFKVKEGLFRFGQVTYNSRWLMHTWLRILPVSFPVMVNTKTQIVTSSHPYLQSHHSQIHSLFFFFCKSFNVSLRLLY